MKAKLKEAYYNFKAGSIVEVEDCGSREFFDLVTPDGNVAIYKWRLELFSSPIEAKKAEIQIAEKTLEKLKAELKELELPKIGQKYLNVSGNKYVVAKLDGLFGLVCYEGENAGRVYGTTANSFDNIFKGCASCFTLIEE